MLGYCLGCLDAKGWVIDRPLRAVWLGMPAAMLCKVVRSQVAASGRCRDSWASGTKCGI